jgi:RNA polymerase sigma-70 factor, ECF subfamily
MAVATPALSAPEPPTPAVPREERLRAMAVDNFQFIWRSLRRLGVPPAGADDAAQQVFEVAARRLDEILPGRERAFLFKTALLVATEARRLAARRREECDAVAVESLSDPGPSPEEASAWRESRALLDQVLDGMAMDLRTVFVLFELEEMPVAGIARLLEIPAGTVASRLRRAREDFHGQAKRVRARANFRGGLP